MNTNWKHLLRDCASLLMASILGLTTGCVLPRDPGNPPTGYSSFTGTNVIVIEEDTEGVLRFDRDAVADVARDGARGTVTLKSGETYEGAIDVREEEVVVAPDAIWIDRNRAGFPVYDPLGGSPNDRNRAKTVWGGLLLGLGLTSAAGLVYWAASGYEEEEPGTLGGSIEKDLRVLFGVTGALAALGVTGAGVVLIIDGTSRPALGPRLSFQF